MKNPGSGSGRNSRYTVYVNIDYLINHVDCGEAAPINHFGQGGRKLYGNQSPRSSMINLLGCMYRRYPCSGCSIFSIGNIEKEMAEERCSRFRTGTVLGVASG